MKYNRNDKMNAENQYTAEAIEHTLKAEKAQEEEARGGALLSTECVATPVGETGFAAGKRCKCFARRSVCVRSQSRSINNQKSQQNACPGNFSIDYQCVWNQEGKITRRQ